jgi:hypothetical protein
MGKPDAMLRQADHGSGQGDKDNLTPLSLDLFQIHVLSGIRLMVMSKISYKKFNAVIL